MSQRTRAALAHHGIKDPGHRSHQLTATDVVRADLIVAFERDHVDYVRRIHPEGATKTATIRYLVATLGNGSRPLADRVAALRLDGVEIGDAEAVVDPAGGDEQTFIDCAVEVSELVDHLLDRL
ncbi:MAG: hypothetical protein OEU32_17340, partial [Acidimicrobiia bacterium]|nr:hypothetical protein [Acidimicrobiia bacterium]